MNVKALREFLDKGELPDEALLQIDLFNSKGEFVTCMIIGEVYRSNFGRLTFKASTEYNYRTEDKKLP